MPAPVASRRRLTSAAVNSAMSLPLVRGGAKRWCGRAAAPPPPRTGGDGAGGSGLSRGLVRSGGLGRGGLGRGLRRGGGLGRRRLGRGDLGRGGLGRGDLGRGGLGGRGGSGVPTGQELALPVGQRLVATDDRLGSLA